MGKTIVVPIVLSLGIAAPAKPCSEAPITIDPMPLLTDGATIPTNPVVVGFARFAPPVRVTPEDGVAEDRIVDRLHHRRRQRERPRHHRARTRRHATATADPPRYPHRAHRRPLGVEHLRFPAHPRYFPGFDVVVADVDLGDEGIAAVRVGEEGDTIVVNPGDSVVVGNGGIGRVAIIDAAGNRSDVIEIDLDAALAADAGGCSQLSTTPTAPALALAGMWLRRGRRRAPLAGLRRRP